MSLKRPHPESKSDTDGQIYISSAIEDRESTFIAHFSPTGTGSELQKHSDFVSASHRIAAWRKPSAQKTLRAERLYDTGHDDDGENWAGKRLEKVLMDMKVEGAVVVARWYGGILLGPVRFTHIENCAREAIGKFKNNGTPSNAEAHVPEHDTKRAKTVEERNEERLQKEQLVETLRERDNSIDVLRQLLVDKQAGQSSQPASPNKAKPTYGGMTLETMTRLEKARDATIGFLLKQIDQAEKDQTASKQASEDKDVEDAEAWAAFDEASADQKIRAQTRDDG